ncbi:MAG: TetR/AcrR family transcriptional regulator [Candidatus Koribacter versatilis]|uniref:TetR/AcrR family transcriptional regulator n=1 Tax=Candidatus Korobacter versatilis TaxID=658062 RepID=A0A932A6N4_9BACT|nr:TetR/AcrR family transcriptional regulator [Candidatus Koribacter versatilis]
MRVAAQDRKQQILDVSARLFARKGFQGTTTREIATRARVNEAILFRHFPTKESLYWAVIEDRCTRSRRRESLQATVDLQASDFEVFRSIAEDILRRSDDDKNRTRLLLFSGLENHRLARRFFKTYVADYYRILAAHIQRRIDQGAFRRVDPLLAARGFMGMIFYHNLVQEIFGGGLYQKFDAETVSAELADTWLRGVLAPAKTNGNGHASKNSGPHKNGLHKNGNGRKR